MIDIKHPRFWAMSIDSYAEAKVCLGGWQYSSNSIYIDAYFKYEGAFYVVIDTRARGDILKEVYIMYKGDIKIVFGVGKDVLHIIYKHVDDKETDDE